MKKKNYLYNKTKTVRQVIDRNELFEMTLKKKKNQKNILSGIMVRPKKDFFKKHGKTFTSLIEKK